MLAAGSHASQLPHFFSLSHFNLHVITDALETDPSYCLAGTGTRAQCSGGWEAGTVQRSRSDKLSPCPVPAEFLGSQEKDFFKDTNRSWLDFQQGFIPW